MTNHDTIKALRDALDIALDLANAEAADVHQRLAGYKPHKHAQADRDVQTVKDGIAALDSLALTADASEDAPDAKVIAKVVSAYGDPEEFGERELIAIADLSTIPYGTSLYAARPAPVRKGDGND